MLNHIQKKIEESIHLKQTILRDNVLLERVNDVVEISGQAFRAEQKILFCGNGGSAADAQHLAAELSGRFYLDRPPLFAEALHLNPSYITAVANDYSYAHIYERAVLAKGKKGDVLWAFSTSGNSENIIRALRQAQALNMITVGWTGETGGKMKNYCDYCINIPSKDTPRIQEMHVLLGHIVCEMIEKHLFG